MDYLPLFARLSGQPCLVVGGGEVASRKVSLLLAAGARITVNAPELSPSLQRLAAEGRITVVARPFDPALVAAHLLSIAATSSRAVNHAVAAEAARCLRFCNVVDDPDASSYISPSIVDRSPLLVAVSSGGNAPVLARLVRQQLDRFLPARLGTLAAWAGRWRDAVHAKLPTQSERRRFWEQAFDNELGEDVLAGRMARADATLQIALDHASDRPIPATPLPGEAWLVGAGPGDPELLTLRAHQVLQHADVVLHDRLVAPAILSFARRDAELIAVGKTGGGASTDQADINRLLVDKVRAGLRVCRLKGGDPFVFGRGGEEAEALAEAGLPFQVVPGITAASGCGAYAGIPLTHRGRAHAVTLVTAQLRPGAANPDPDWASLAVLGQTLVVYMPARRLRDIGAALLAHGRAAHTPAALVISGTTSRQRVLSGTLGDIADLAEAAALNASAGDRDDPAPSILFIGEVVALASRLAWFAPAADAGGGPSAAGV